MSVWDCLYCCCSNRGRARWRYKRGMARAKKHNHEGAIDDYTTVIDIVETPADLRAMALYRRALLHVASGNDAQSVDDLNRLLAMDELLVNTKTMARQKLATMSPPQSPS